MMLVVLVVIGGGCSITSTSGPEVGEVRRGGHPDPADPERLPYAFMRMTPEVVDILATWARTIVHSFADRRPAKEITFGIGDAISVTIFEAAAGGLFIPIEAVVRPGNFVTLPNQNVDTSGNISVPYAGLVPALGKMPSQVETTIVDRIKNRAIEPQAVVALVNQNTSLISVLGEVNTPGRFPTATEGEHLLDTIAKAGGPKFPGNESWVMLERQGRGAMVPFGALVYEPANNIWSHPYDTIYLYREPQTFLAFGAQGQQGQFNFDAWRISLAEAVGKAGGLNDSLAEPRRRLPLPRRDPRSGPAHGHRLLALPRADHSGHLQCELAQPRRLLPGHQVPDARQRRALRVECDLGRDRESAGLFATGRGDGLRPDRGGAERDHPAQPDQDRAVALLTRPMSPPAQAGGLARREPGSADALRAVQSREVPGVIDEEQITGVVKILADEIFGFKLELNLVVAHHTGIHVVRAETERDLLSRVDAQLHGPRGPGYGGRLNHEPAACEFERFVGSVCREGGKAHHHRRHDVCSNHSHCSQLRCNNAPVQAMRQGGIERSCERLEARRLRGM
jgi:polysaccharide biosynthesis/export protein